MITPFAKEDCRSAGLSIIAEWAPEAAKMTMQPSD